MYVLSTIFDLTDTVDLLATPIGYCNLFYSIYLPFCLCNLDVNYFSLQLALLEIIACYNVNICEHRTSCVWEHLFVLFCLLWVGSGLSFYHWLSFSWTIIKMRPCNFCNGSMSVSCTNILRLVGLAVHHWKRVFNVNVPCYVFISSVKSPRCLFSNVINSCRLEFSKGQIVLYFHLGEIMFGS